MQNAKKQCRAHVDGTTDALPSRGNNKSAGFNAHAVAQDFNLTTVHCIAALDAFYSMVIRVATVVLDPLPSEK